MSRPSRKVAFAGAAAIAKTRVAAPPDFFAAEVRGLDALRGSDSLRVPAVFAFAVDAIVLEDLGRGVPARAHWEAAGRGLARLHARRAATFGFADGGYCGDSAQDNSADADGFRFFAERRLLPQARRARDGGLLDARAAARIDAVCRKLPELLPAAAPVLIHGDLWTGNLHACANGELTLIDGGAVHHGWAECDLAMLTLFGSPPAPFFAAYEDAAVVAAGWRGRAPLLNLYHLLNHLNLFGASYLRAVEDVASRFA